MGAIKAFPMMCPFIFHTLQLMDIVARSIWNSGENKDEGEDSKEGIEEFDLGNGVKVWFVESGNGVDGPEQIDTLRKAVATSEEILGLAQGETHRGILSRPEWAAIAACRKRLSVLNFDGNAHPTSLPGR